VKQYRSAISNDVTKLASSARPRVRSTSSLSLAALLLCTAFGAALGTALPAKADSGFSIAGIAATLRGAPPAPDTSYARQPTASAVDDEAFGALTAFAAQIKGSDRRANLKTSDDTVAQSDDPVFAALKAFAERAGPAPTASTKDMPKFAEADNALDALRDFMKQKSEPAPASPKVRASAPAKRVSAPVDATYVGDKACTTCHATGAAEFSKTMMGKIGKTKPGMFGCENCHGPGSAHVKAGGGRGVGDMISFRKDDPSRTVEENNMVCLGCHEKGQRTNWHGSTHETQNVACTNCHTVMKDVSRKHGLKTKFEADTCFECHKNKRAEVHRQSHMPVVEGKMTCSSCHNPHGSYSEAMLKTATPNETCFKCHAEKRGPFLWEHAPVTENCMNCHDAHGSNNDSMLKISRPRLCQQCHSGGQHNSNPRNPLITLYAQGKECQNCHSNHHGSNNPAGARFLR
jgi:DmsE family decaheme c-type cytochrome